jgi:hypothetical protein
MTTMTRLKFDVGALAALLLAFGLLVGCGDNSADTPGAEAEPVATTEAPDAAVTQQDLAAKQREAEERLAAIEAREAEVARREAAATKRSSATTPSKASVASAPRRQAPVEPVVQTVNVVLPASTSFEVELAQGVSSDESAVGDPVNGFVVQNVVQDGMVVVPAGSEIRGQVVEVKGGKKIGGQAKVVVGFDTLRLASGGEVAITSSIEFVGKKQAGKDAATIGGSAAAGALLGRVLGGDDKDKNTAIGAVVGAGVGTAVAANNKTDPVLVPAGQVTQVLLYEPLHLTVVRDAAAPSVASR